MSATLIDVSKHQKKNAANTELEYLRMEKGSKLPDVKKRLGL